MVRLDDGDWLCLPVHRHHSFGSDTYLAKSHALFCPSCQTVWAILKFVDDTEVWPVAQFCENCDPKASVLYSPWYPVPGSLLVEEGWGVIDESLLAVLPEQFLKREFNLHLKAYS